MTIEDAWAELNDFLIGDDYGPEDLDAPKIDARDSANRAGRALARLQRDEDEIRAVVQAERERLDAFLADRIHGIEKGRARIAAALEGFMRAEFEATAKTSIKLPSLTLSLRKPIDRIDGDVGEDHAKTHPTIVRVKPVDYELDKVAAKAALTPGPLVEGLTAAARAETGDPSIQVRAAVDAAGEAVVGVFYVTSPRKTFGWKLTGEDDGQ